MERGTMKNTLLSLLILVFAASFASAQSSADSAGLSAREIKDRLDGVAENLNTLNTDVNALKALKISGYLQLRYEYNDSSRSTDTLIKGSAVNRNANNFYIRRGRIKFTFQPGQTSKYVIYFDASKNTVSLKEAFVELMHKYRSQAFALTAGQFNIPFGYEIEYSSSRRDFPERSLAENNLFKGERDRGINLTYTAPKYLTANIGVLQGYGIDNATFTWFDPSKQKDVVARAKAKLGKFDLGLSGYWGKTYTPSVAAVAGSSSWYDANGNKQVDTNEVTTTAPKQAVAGFERDKDRYGIDGQAYLDFLPIGGTGLRGEYFKARDYNKDAKAVVHEQGWYLWLSQNIGKKLGAAVRYDFWDPNTRSNQNDATGTWSFAAHYFYDHNVRITAAYDIPNKLKGNSTFTKYSGDVKDNRFTLQFQFVI
jgi:hypothetical protein